MFRQPILLALPLLLIGFTWSQFPWVEWPAATAVIAYASYRTWLFRDTYGRLKLGAARLPIYFWAFLGAGSIVRSRHRDYVQPEGLISRPRWRDCRAVCCWRN